MRSHADRIIRCWPRSAHPSVGEVGVAGCGGLPSILLLRLLVQPQHRNMEGGLPPANAAALGNERRKHFSGGPERQQQHRRAAASR